MCHRGPKNLLVLLMAASSIGAPPTLAEAQTLFAPAARQGYFVGGGVRSGVFLAHSDDLGSLGLMQGGAFVLRGGQMASDLLGFGVLLSTGGGSNTEWGGGYGALSLEGQFIPMPRENLSFRASLGIAGLGVARTDEASRRKDDPDGGLGTLYALGMSYDWFPFYDSGDGSGGLAFTPFFEVQLVTASELLSGAIFTGFEVTYWLGLGSDRLAP